MQELGISELMANVLIKRNISLEDAKLLYNNPIMLLENPEDIYGMREVANKIVELYQEKPDRPFLIFADYDVDGMTSGYIMTSCLGELGLDTYPYFPERYEGYGLSIAFAEKVVEQMKDQLPVVITVDNGITAYEAADFLQEHNIPVLITDHHLPVSKEELPGDLQTDPWIDEKAGTHLCGAAVAWKTCLLVEELLEYLTGNEQNICQNYIPFVGIGLITDVMPPHIENRAIVKMALESINNKEVPLMNMFSEVFSIKNFTSKDIAWSVGPKFNSASRLGNTELATDVFFLQNPGDKDELEDKMVDIARMDNERKKLTDKAIAKAMEHSEEFLIDPICLFNCEGYPHGIAGIIAGKLAETFQKPALVYVEDKVEDIATASCRGFNLDIKTLINIAASKGYAIGAFGHSFACGATLIPSCFEELKQCIKETLEEMIASGQLIQEEIKFEPDYYMTPEDINGKTLQELNAIPYLGDYPVLAFKNQSVEYSTPFKNKEHLVLKLADNKYAVGWNMLSNYKELGYPDTLNLVGKLDEASFSAKTLGLKNSDVIFLLDEIS